MGSKYTNENIDAAVTNRTVVRIGTVVNAGTNLLWKCSICSHEWEATPYNVIKRGSGCPSCAGNKRITDHDVDVTCNTRNIRRLDSVISNSVNIRWQCLACEHVWSTRPSKIMCQGTGCPKCANRIKLTNDDVDQRCASLNIRRIGEYSGIHTKIQWECTTCNHRWAEKPSNVLTQHTDCPKCRVPYYSKKAVAWLRSIEAQTGATIQHAERGGEFIIPGTRYRVDGYDQSTNTVYEFYGDMWHGNPAIYRPDAFCSPFHKETAGELFERTMRREQLITNLGYNIVSIWEKDYDTATQA